MLATHPLWSCSFKGLWTWHKVPYVRAGWRWFWLSLGNLTSREVVSKVRDVDGEVVLPGDTLHGAIVLVQRGGQPTGKVCIGEVRE